MKIVFGLLMLAGLLWFAPDIKKLARRNREKLLKPGIARSVEIARNQQWVSPQRLKAEARTAQWLARIILQEACRQGYLYQAADGRYYVCRRQRLAPRTSDSR